MPLAKISLLMQFVTAPTQRSYAAPHAGGWSEQLWSTNSAPSLVDLQLLAINRASLLPEQAAVVGARVQVYTINANKLIPGGSSVVQFQYPGNSNYTIDVPQACLFVNLTSAGAANHGRYCLRGMPDEFVVNGEFAPDFSFQFGLNRYRASIVGAPYGFVGRQLTNATANVLGSDGTSIIVDNVAGLVVGGYLRFLKVHDKFGGEIIGTFQISALPAGNKVTLVNGVGSDAQSGGKVRVDGIAFFGTTDSSVGRVGVKKVGRPFAGYVGRRSKRKLGT